MVDPAFIALFGTIGFGVLFKTVEHYFGTPRAITPKAGENYDERWGDPEYVKMIHRTRESEMEVFGEYLSECECKEHSTHYDPHMLRDRPVRKNDIPSLTVGGNRYEGKWKTVIDGWQFELPIRLVPEGAYGQIMSVHGDFAYGFFKWTDPATGKQKGMKAVSVAKMVAVPGVQYMDNGTMIMDSWTANKYKAITEQVRNGIITPSEA